MFLLTVSQHSGLSNMSLAAGLCSWNSVPWHWVHPVWCSVQPQPIHWYSLVLTGIHLPRHHMETLPSLAVCNLFTMSWRNITGIKEKIALPQMVPSIEISFLHFFISPRWLRPSAAKSFFSTLLCLQAFPFSEGFLGPFHAFSTLVIFFQTFHPCLKACRVSAEIKLFPTN